LSANPNPPNLKGDFVFAVVMSRFLSRKTNSFFHFFLGTNVPDLATEYQLQCSKSCIMSKKKIIITGVSGFVGGNLARVLISQGAEVKGLIRQDRRAVEGLDIQLLEGDLLDPQFLKRAFQDADVVYHLAATISLTGNSPQMKVINVVGTRNVVEACLSSRVRRLVHCSSIHAFVQTPLNVPLDESRPLALDRHHPAYDVSKAAGEIEVHKGLEKGLDAVIINPTGITGPFDFKPSFFGKAILAMSQGKIPALVKGGFDWVDVRDVVSGMIRAEEVAPTGSNYLLSGNWRSVEEINKLVVKFTNTKQPRIIVPIWIAYLGLPVINLISKITRNEALYTRFSLSALKSNRHVSHARATRDLGFQPRPFEETIFDTLQWFKENGYM
jgi:dihydroflavonol-4-reductase